MSEHNEQSAFVETILLTYQNRADFIRPLFFATLSGAWIAGNGSRKMGLIMKYKQEGWINGVADLLYLQPRGQYSFLAIEMKTKERQKEKNGGASDSQMEWLESANQAGALTAVCHGAEAALGVFSLYMELSIR